MLLNHIHGLVVEVCLVCKAKHFFHRLFDQVSRLFQLVLLLPIVLENVLDVWIVNFISVVIINQSVLSFVCFSKLGFAQISRQVVSTIIRIVILVAIIFFTFLASLLPLFLWLLYFLVKFSMKVVNCTNYTRQEQIVTEGDSECKA